MRTRSLGYIVLPLLVVLGLAPVAEAQRTTASIRGTVTDPSGSTVEAATVTVNNTETGFTRTTGTNEAGIYTFGDLPLGPYQVQVEFPGFKSAQITGIELNVADDRRINVALELGAVEEEVTTVASTLSVETIGGEVAGLITGEQIRELPLNGRNFTQLTLLMPGVSAPDGFDSKNKGLLTGTDLSVSGGATTGNLWTVDGANNNDVGSNRTILIYPSVDTIEEFKIHRNSYGAEFGGASGAQINLVTRSGSNKYQGSVSFFVRDDSLNETNFFLDRAGLDTEPLSREDFGYTFGGPILQDKLHFFVSQEWNNEERGVVRQGLVPTVAERNGDFSASGADPCSAGVPIDPLTGLPFPGNVIPDDRLSGAGASLLNLYPNPNVTPAAGSCNNWLAAVLTPIDWRQDNARLDYTVNQKTRLMMRYTRDEWENGAPNAGGSNGLWGDDPFPAVDSSWNQKGESLVLQLNNTIGTNAVNTLTYSYSGNEIDIARGGDNPGLNAEINAAIPTIFPDDGKTGEEERSHPVFWGGQGYGALWNIAPWQNEQDLSVLKDDYSQVFGKHWVKVGALYSDNIKKEFIGGASAFESPQFWGSTGINGGAGGATGNILADFLLEGMTFGFSENSIQPAPELNWSDVEVYVSDSWQVSSRVTFDYGVRYSRFELPYATGNIISAFNPDAFDPALGNDPCNGLVTAPGTDPCGAAGFLGGIAASDRALTETDDLFAPRLGLAWDVFGNGRSALRAGFGQFYLRDRVNIQLEFAGNPPFTSSQSGMRTLDSPNEPCAGCFNLSNGAPRVGIEADSETPYSLQWNLTWEQQLGASSTLEVSYVGNKGVHLTRRSDINQVRAGDNNGNGVDDRLEYVQANGDGSLRPFSAFGDAQILFWEHNGRSEYHSLQTQYVARFGRGSQFQASYTWSDLKADDPLNDSGAGTFPGQITDRDNFDLDYGLAEIHREHVFNASLVWNLPTFEGSRGLKRAILGDWQIGTIVQYSSGTPITVYTGGVPGINGLSGTGFSNNQRPNVVPGVSCSGGGGPDEQFINPDAFTLTGFQLGSNGNAGRGICEGPDYFQVDMSFYKNFRIGKRIDAQFRIEVFNIFNRDNFINVDNTLDPVSVTLDAPQGQATQVTGFTPSASFGQATGVRDPRQIQLGLRLRF